MPQITMALTKGRILKETLPLLKQVNIEPLEDLFTSRKLVFSTTRDDLRLLIFAALMFPPTYNLALPT